MSAKRLANRKKTQIERDTDYLLNTKFRMKRVNPLTENQSRTFDSYDQEKNLLLVGSAGTGKTYIALYLALKDVMATKSKYKQVIIVRSTVQSRDQGYMPGDEKQKAAHFETPYADIVNDLFERGDAYHIMKQKNMIKFMSTSFIRGLTFDNSLIIVDEIQNCNYGELRAIASRLGQDSRIILCGDTKQDDLIYSKNRADISGLIQFKRVVDRMKGGCFDTVQFTTDDIVRSGFVKQFIIAEEELLEAA
jgi:predicted ribonuclease YlaK